MEPSIIWCELVCSMLTPAARSLFGNGERPSTPCWSGVGAGWTVAVVRALEAIAEACPGARVSQVKQKFCGLRLGVDLPEEVTPYQAWLVGVIVQAAVEWCWQACEDCDAQIDPHGPMGGAARCDRCRGASCR